MAMLSETGLGRVLAEEADNLRRNWFWLLALGTALVIIGLMAIGSSVIATLTTVIILGTLIILGGIVEIVDAFCAHCSRGFWPHLLAGILYLVLGFLLVQRPVAAAATFTLVLAAGFFVGGLFRIVSALVDRFHGRWWVFLNGVVTLVLGVMIWQAWPESSLRVIGLFVGIDMVFAGWAWIMLALTIRSIPARSM